MTFVCCESWCALQSVVWKWQTVNFQTRLLEKRCTSEIEHCILWDINDILQDLYITGTLWCNCMNYSEYFFQVLSALFQYVSKAAISTRESKEPSLYLQQPLSLWCDLLCSNYDGDNKKPGEISIDINLCLCLPLVCRSPLLCRLAGSPRRRAYS